MEPIRVRSNGKTFKVWTNPSHSELTQIGSLVRFTADNKTKNFYVWEFNSGRHGNVSVGLKLDDPFDSLDFLKGHAGKNDKGTYQMIGSDFLQSFVGRLAGKEKVFLSNLLNQSWDWVDSYIRVTGWLHSFAEQTLR
ncbi:MAG: hypothetical protein ACYDHG_11480 [Desulfomonilaceae bacterium]